MNSAAPEPMWATYADVAHLAYRCRRELGLYVRLPMRPRTRDPLAVRIIAEPREMWRSGEKGLRPLAAAYALEASRVTSIGPDASRFGIYLGWTFLAWNSGVLLRGRPYVLKVHGLPHDITNLDGPAIRDIMLRWGPTFDGLDLPDGQNHRS